MPNFLWLQGLRSGISVHVPEVVAANLDSVPFMLLAVYIFSTPGFHIISQYLALACAFGSN